MDMDLLKELERQSKEIAKAVTTPVQQNEAENTVQEAIQKNKEVTKTDQKVINQQKDNLKRKNPKYDEPTAIKRHSSKIKELISKNQWQNIKPEELPDKSPWYYEEVKDDEGNLVEYRMYLKKGNTYITRLSNKYYNTIINAKDIFEGIDELKVTFNSAAKAILIKLPNDYYLFDVVDGNGPILVFKYTNEQFEDVKRFNHVLAHKDKLKSYLKKILNG